MNGRGLPRPRMASLNGFSLLRVWLPSVSLATSEVASGRATLASGRTRPTSGRPTPVSGRPRLASGLFSGRPRPALSRRGKEPEEKEKIESVFTRKTTTRKFFNAAARNVFGGSCNNFFQWWILVNVCISSSLNWLLQCAVHPSVRNIYRRHCLSCSRTTMNSAEVYEVVESHANTSPYKFFNTNRYSV
jgi:hypothetical protein